MTNQLPDLEFFTLSETARKLGVSVDTLRRWEKKGKINGIRTEGGHRRFSLEEVENFRYKKIREKIRPITYDSPAPSPVISPIIPPVIAPQIQLVSKYDKMYQKPPFNVSRYLKFVYILFLFLVLFFFAKLGLPAKLISYLPEEIKTKIVNTKDFFGQQFGFLRLAETPESSSYIKNYHSGAVLAETTSRDLSFDVNIDSRFRGNLGVDGSATVSGTLTANNFTTNGNITGQSITSTGAITGTTGTFTGNLTIPGIVTNATTFNLVNTNATTLNIGGVATTISLGATSGTTTVKNDLKVSGAFTSSGKITASGDMAVSGALTVSGATTLSSSLAVTGNISKINGVSYTWPTTQGAANTFLIDNGSGTLSWGTLSGVSIGQTAGTVIFAGSSNDLSGDTTNFFWDNTNKRLGIGTNSPTRSLHVAGGVTLGGATTDLITFTGRVTSGTSLIPAVNLGSDLGTTALRWNNLYVGTVNSNSTLSTTGQALFTYTPTDTTYGQSSVQINPTTAPANSFMLGIGIAGAQMAGIDAEGDLTLGYSGGAGTSAPNNANPLSIYNHGTTNLLTLTTGGNLGIGAVTSPTGNGTTVMQIAGNGSAGANNYGSITLSNPGTSTNNILGSLDFYGSTTRLAGIRATSRSGVTQGNMIFSALSGGSFSDYMTLDPNGSQGLLTLGASNGTLNGSAAIFNTSAGATVNALVLGNESNTAQSNVRISFKGLANDASINEFASVIGVHTASGATTVTGDLAFNTVNAGVSAEVMRISSGGKVGIGTIGPNEALDIVGNATMSGTLGFKAIFSTDVPTCDATAKGKIYFDGQRNQHYFCNGTNWRSLVGLQDQNRQDITTNNLVHNQVVRKGWGFITGNGGVGTVYTSTVTFGITYDDIPIVTSNRHSGRSAASGAPSGNLGSCNAGSSWYITSGKGGMTSAASVTSFVWSFGIATTGDTAIASGDFVCYTWSATGSYAAGADLAEYYRSTQQLEAGDVVAISKTEDKKINKSSGSYDRNAIGIVSTQPGQVLEDENGKSTQPDAYPIALAGRVPVKVSLEAGVIERGDPLTTSSVPGVAMKATRSGPIIGKAMERFDGTATVSTLPWTGSIDKNDPDLKELDKGIGKIIVFINNTWWGDTAQNQLSLSNINDFSDGDFLMPYISKKDNSPIVLFTKFSDVKTTLFNSEILQLTNLKGEYQTVANKNQENTNQIQDLSASIASVSAQLANIESDIQLLKSTQLVATASGNVLGTATDSANLTNLSVLKNTILSDTVVNGKLNIGMLTIDNTNNSIDAVGTLKIQSLALGNVEFMNGKVTIDTTGNVVVNTIAAKKYAVVGTSAGSSKIPAGQTSLDVQTDQITDGSIVMVTPTSSVSTPIVVVQKTKGVGFTVHISFPQTIDTSFDWWIVDKQ